MRRVLCFQHRVESPEAERCLGGKPPTPVELFESREETVPKAAVGPVLDCERGAEGERGIVRAVDLVELVAEVERCRRTVLPLAQI